MACVQLSESGDSQKYREHTKIKRSTESVTLSLFIKNTEKCNLPHNSWLRVSETAF